MKHALLCLCILLGGISGWAQKKTNDITKTVQRQLIMAEAGDTIRLGPGKFTAVSTLSLDDKKDIVLLGAGMDKTFISFKKQQEGAEGIRVSGCKNIVLKDFSVEDAKGDAIKVINTEGISFVGVRTAWTGKPSKKNGAYGLYPVSCEKVLVDDCEAIGASDAGIYVGQSHQIIVKNSRAYKNVAGIEIENSTQAEVFKCEATGNTGGILVFDLPGLPKKKGGDVRVYDNHVYENNLKNFAPKGNTVADIPPGTGIMILAASGVEVFNNRIEHNRTVNMSIVSYYMTERPFKDPEYDPYPSAINIHDNTFLKEKKRPTFSKKIGLLLYTKFKRQVPDILYDGIVNPKMAGANGLLEGQYQICIKDNGDATFANLDAENNFKNITRDLSLYNCEHQAIEPVSMSRK